VARSPVERLESRLHPYVAFAIMPFFALVNAGLSLKGLTLTAGAPLTVVAGVVFGLVIGKPLGICLASWTAVRLGLCALPAGVSWRHVVLLGVLGGIGFTMSIFISNLAFEERALLGAAKFGVLLSSAVAASLGFLVGRLQTDGGPRITPA
jgi:NhaA family Na+:H+ antiporter